MIRDLHFLLEYKLQLQINYKEFWEMELVKGRPLHTEGRLEKEVRLYAEIFDRDPGL